MRILVVEDEKKVASFIQSALEQDGCAVDVLPDGDQAGEQAQIIDYDCVVLDLMLPGRSGFQVLRDIRARKPDLPVLILSAHASPEERVTGLNAGSCRKSLGWVPGWGNHPGMPQVCSQIPRARSKPTSSIRRRSLRWPRIWYCRERARIAVCAALSVSLAHSGRKALECVETIRPDVVLLDIGMPGMDGYEVARRIRTNPANRHISLIALTGWGQDEDRKRSVAAGFNHHLVKPADIEQLRQLLTVA